MVSCNVMLCHPSGSRVGRCRHPCAGVRLGLFSNSRSLLIVPEVREKLLDAWGIDAGVNVGKFTRGQSAYLDSRRSNVFKHALFGP